MVIIQELNKEDIEFADIPSAIEFLLEKRPMNFTIRNETESFAFFGGKLLYADTPQFLKLGNWIARKV